MSFRDITTNPAAFFKPLLTNQTRISRIVACIFAVATAWLLGQMVWLFLPTTALVPWSPTQQVSNQTKPNQQLDVSAIQRGNLFGRYQTETKPQPKVVQDAPKSRLNVTLVGVVTSSQPELSLAVLANRGQQSTYGVNEMIEGTRAKIVAVHSDRVIVNNAGRDETVMLQGIDYSKRSTEQPRDSSRGAPREREEASNASRPKRTLNLDDVRADIQENPQQIFQYIRMSQVKRDNDVIGYRLSPGSSAALFNEVGLQQGDIAVQLNGKDLSDPEVMTEIFESISDLTELNLTVERDGQPYDIYISL